MNYLCSCRAIQIDILYAIDHLLAFVKTQPLIHHYPAIIAFLGYYPFEHETDTVGGKFLYLRNAKGYTYKMLGEYLGVHASTVREWELQKDSTLLERALQKINHLL